VAHRAAQKKAPDPLLESGAKLRCCAYAGRG
jgi:hypothetical protein